MKSKFKISSFWIILVVLLLIFFAAGFYLSRQWVRIPNLKNKSVLQAGKILSNRKLSMLVRSPESYRAASPVKAQYPPAGKWVKPPSRVILYLDVRGTLRIPNLMAARKEEAELVLAAFGLIPVFNSQPCGLEKNTVIDQDPPSGSLCQTNDKVHLTISQGLLGLEAPDLIGKSWSEAQEITAPLGIKLRAQGFIPGRDAQIIKQNPETGEALLKDEIQVTCQETLVVPELRGKTRSQAEKIIKQAGFKPGKITYQSQAYAPKGLVLEQNPTSGLEVDPGSKIDLTVADGKKERK